MWQHSHLRQRAYQNRVNSNLKHVNGEDKEKTVMSFIGPHAAYHREIWEVPPLETENVESLTRLASKELRRYLFITSGVLPNLNTFPEHVVAAWLLGDNTTKMMPPGVQGPGKHVQEVVLLLTSNNAVHLVNLLHTKKLKFGGAMTKARFLVDAGRLETQDHFLHTLKVVLDNGDAKLPTARTLHLVMGGGPSGILYGAYRFVEISLGVMFSLHGDILPDLTVPVRNDPNKDCQQPSDSGISAGNETKLWFPWLCRVIPPVSELSKPLFEVRGLHFTHGNLQGPDLWDADTYKERISNMAKLRLNMLSIRATRSDPLVFQGPGYAVDADVNSFLFGASKLFAPHCQGFCGPSSDPLAHEAATMREATAQAEQLLVETNFGFPVHADNNHAASSTPQKLLRLSRAFSVDFVTMYTNATEGSMQLQMGVQAGFRAYTQSKEVLPFVLMTMADASNPKSPMDLVQTVATALHTKNDPTAEFVPEYKTWCRKQKLAFVRLENKAFPLVPQLEVSQIEQLVRASSDSNADGVLGVVARGLSPDLAAFANQGFSSGAQQGSLEFWTTWIRRSFGGSLSSKHISQLVQQVFISEQGSYPSLPDGCHNTLFYAKRVQTMRAIRTHVRGLQNLERFDYWRSQFEYVDAVNQCACAWKALGQSTHGLFPNFNGTIKPGSKRLVHSVVMPFIRRLFSSVKHMVQALLQHVQTGEEIGTVANLFRVLDTMLDTSDTTKPVGLIHAIVSLSEEDLELTSGYGASHPPRLLVPFHRTSLRIGEPLRLRAIVLAQTAPLSVTLKMRTFLDIHFHSYAMKRLGGSHVYEVQLPAASSDFEYFVSAKMSNTELLVVPAQAPLICQTVVVRP